MNQLSILLLVSAIATGFAFLWDTARNELTRVRSELSSLEATRDADNEALRRVQEERDEIARKYETLSQELKDIEDAPAVDYLNTPVPPSLRRLLERK